MPVKKKKFGQFKMGECQLKHLEHNRISAKYKSGKE